VPLPSAAVAPPSPKGDRPREASSPSRRRRVAAPIGSRGAASRGVPIACRRANHGSCRGAGPCGRCRPPAARSRRGASDATPHPSRARLLGRAVSGEGGGACRSPLPPPSPLPPRHRPARPPVEAPTPSSAAAGFATGKRRRRRHPPFPPPAPPRPARAGVGRRLHRLKLPSPCPSSRRRRLPRPPAAALLLREAGVGRAGALPRPHWCRRPQRRSRTRRVWRPRERKPQLAPWCRASPPPPSASRPHAPQDRRRLPPPPLIAARRPLRALGAGRGEGPHVRAAETAAAAASLSPPAALPWLAGGRGGGPRTRSPSLPRPPLVASPELAADRASNPPPHIAAEPPPPTAARRRRSAVSRRRPRPTGTSPH